MHWIDPEQLAVTKGDVERFLINPHGEIDGVLLVGGREIHVPPHLGETLRASVEVGGQLVVRGLKPRGCDMICAVSFGGADGLAVVDEGPPDGHKKHAKHRHGSTEPMSVDGTVARFLHGAKGEVRGALLDNGVQLRWKKHESEEIERRIGIGDWLVAEGEAQKAVDAVVLDVERIAARDRAPRPARSSRA